MLRCFLRRQKQPQYVRVELSVKLVLCDFGEWCKLINTRIVDENVQPAECLDGLGENATHVGRGRHISLDCDGLAAFALDLRHDTLGAVLTRGVVHDNGCAFLSQSLRNARPDALRRACHYGYSTRQLIHVSQAPSIS